MAGRKFPLSPSRGQNEVEGRRSRGEVKERTRRGGGGEGRWRRQEEVEERWSGEVEDKEKRRIEGGEEKERWKIRRREGAVEETKG